MAAENGQICRVTEALCHVINLFWSTFLHVLVVLLLFPFKSGVGVVGLWPYLYLTFILNKAIFLTLNKKIIYKTTLT